MQHLRKRSGGGAGSEREVEAGGFQNPVALSPMRVDSEAKKVWHLEFPRLEKSGLGLGFWCEVSGK